MKMYRECSLTDFEPWAGAVDRYKVLTYEQLGQLDAILEEMYPEGASETTINDLLWFDEDWISEMLGFEDWEALERFNNGEEVKKQTGRNAFRASIKPYSKDELDLYRSSSHYVVD